MAQNTGGPDGSDLEDALRESAIRLQRIEGLAAMLKVATEALTDIATLDGMGEAKALAADAISQMQLIGKERVG